MARSRRSLGNCITRGRPEDTHVQAMASVWLEEQRKAWPGQVALFQGTATDAELIEKMVGQFQANFGAPVTQVPSDTVPGKTGLAYCRFSSDNSNPRSLCQQLRNILVKAAELGFHIPWRLVFADAAISGTTAHRAGYQQAKAAIFDLKEVDCMFVDDLSRATRAASENMAITEQIIDSGKRLIAVSDGVDIKDQESDLNAGIRGLINKKYIDSLKSKVDRGMRDAFLQKRIITPPAFGYRRVFVTDEKGQPIPRGKNKFEARIEIDEAEAQEVRTIFEDYVIRRKSTHQIAKELNQRKAGGKTTWLDAGVKQLLKRHVYSGVEYWGMTKLKTDRRSNRSEVVPIPKDQWIRRDVPELRIVDKELFDRAQALLLANDEKNSKRKARGARSPEYSHAMIYPKLIFRPICKTCQWPLVLGNSSLQYSALMCSRGNSHRGECPLHGYKSVSLIEACILGAIRDRVFTPDFLARWLEQANKFLLDESSKPRRDTGPLKKRIAEIHRHTARLTDALINDEGQAPKAITERLRELEETAVVLEKQLREMEALNNPVPPPITELDLNAMLGKWEELLKMEPGAAAEVIRRFVGPIEVEPTDIKSKRGKAWRLRFSVNGTAMMATIGAGTDSPNRESLEFLTHVNWRMGAGEDMEVLVSDASLNESDRRRAVELRESGHNVSQIAEILKRTRPYVKRLLNPDHVYLQSASTASGMKQRLRRYENLAVEGLRLKAQGLSIEDICGELRTKRDALMRAFAMAEEQGWDLKALQGKLAG